MLVTLLERDTPIVHVVVGAHDEVFFLGLNAPLATFNVGASFGFREVRIIAIYPAVDIGPAILLSSSGFGLRPH